MSIPIWNAVHKLAQHAEELAARVERLEQHTQDELANWRTAAIRQGEIERRLERLEQAQQQPEPEPEDDQTLHTVALRIVNELERFGLSTEFQEIMRRAIREPMAQPAPSTPAGKGELVRSVADTMGHHSAIAREADSCRAIMHIADWLDARGNRGAAEALRREVGL
jgi:hypothetical protein